MAQKKINFNINDGGLFYSDEVAVVHNPLKFFLDFKNTSPRVDMRSSDHQPMVMQHNVVMMDPYTAKSFLEVLQENIGKYEAQFGPIEMTSAQKKAEEKAKKKMEMVTTEDKRPSYFG